MELHHKPRPGTEAPSLLRSYRWQTLPRNGEKEPEPSPRNASGGSKRRGKLQKWKRVQSQPDSELPPSCREQQPPAGAHPDNRAHAKRSVFQRAFSTPAKMPKGPEGSGKLSLRKYLRSMSHWKSQEGAPRSERESKEASKGDEPPAQLTQVGPSLANDATLWDVATVSLLDRQIMILDRDEEGLLQGRKRTSSSVSESSSLYPPSSQRDCEMTAERRSLLDSQAPDKRPFQESPSGPQLSNVKGLLWRRIRERKGRMNTKSDSSVTLTANGDRESPPGPALLVDLGNEKDVLIRPLHSSLLGERFCFEDNCERVERMLSLWVYEARDLLPKKRYFCKLLLDGILYARTTTKLASPTGAIFWGEHFDLKTLPPAVDLQVCLVQEEEGQRPKGSAIANTSIPLKDLAAVRQPLEKWYPLGRDKHNNVPTLRLRGRYCDIHVLPIVQYKEFAEYLTFHYQELCAGLEHNLNARDKEELTGVLVRVLQSTGKAKAFLIDLGVAELDRFDEREALIFRENTLATKAIDEYMKLVGGPYLLATLSGVIAQHHALADSCEVDPSKCAPCDLADNRNNLQQICEDVFLRIAESSHSFPAELSEVFTAWQEACHLRGKAGIGQRLISASLFLRFLCPAIMSPSLFGLTQEYPDDATSRTLTLVAKVIQNLANFTTFGEKEAYMSFMNEFLKRNWDTMKSFLSAVSSPGSAMHLAAYDNSIDLALELSILHSLLCNIFSTLEERTQERMEPLPTILRAIQEGTPVPVSVQLGPSMMERQTEKLKLGFLPPRELGKHSPLIKSHSMTSIQKGRGKEEPVVPLHPAKTRSKVHRTQSVPTQGKVARRLPKQSSTENVAEHQDGSPQPGIANPYGGGGGNSKASQGSSKLHPSASLPRKSTVPWLRHSEEAAVTQSDLYVLRPLEQYGRQMEVLQTELTAAKEKQKLFEEQLEKLTAQNQMLLEEQVKFQEQEETLCKRLEETESLLVQLSSRMSGVEGSWKKDHEKLRISEEKTKCLEHRLSAMERDHDQLLRAVSQMLGFRGKPSNAQQRPLSGPVWVNRTENGDET
ncbi:hypothetical protein lerEdw1_002147 [Lerista edwardsae]|nr:hypothetical protein lerEdw1_002147 [Lerista edwardsae]